MDEELSIVWGFRNTDHAWGNSNPCRHPFFEVIRLVSKQIPEIDVEKMAVFLSEHDVAQMSISNAEDKSEGWVESKWFQEVLLFLFYFVSWAFFKEINDVGRAWSPVIDSVQVSTLGNNF